MENKLENLQIMITSPQEGDDVAVGVAHKQAWIETYLDPENGITEETVDTLIGHVATESGNEYRRRVFIEAEAHPEKVLYRVIRSGNKVIGFMHCTKEDDKNELGGIYLLNEAKGRGIGDTLMQEFLAWADKDKPCYLGVFSMNERAIKFYEKYGFRKVDGPQTFYKEVIPHFEMIRPAEN